MSSVHLLSACFVIASVAAELPFSSQQHESDASHVIRFPTKAGDNAPRHHKFEKGAGLHSSTEGEGEGRESLQHSLPFSAAPHEPSRITRFKPGQFTDQARTIKPSKQLVHLVKNNSQAATPQLIPATKHLPSLLCERVKGMNGKPGLLCRPLPGNKTNANNSTHERMAQQVAKELAVQARRITPDKAAVKQMHAAPAVYQWEASSTFKYISTKKHFYNVHYADSSALKIKTGQDVLQLGPYRVYTRFGLIEEAVSGQPGADLQGADGILGFGYSNFPRSASVVKTLSEAARPSWNLTQPPDMPHMQRQMFAVLSSWSRGELQLGGYDEMAVQGGEAGLHWTPMANQSGYGVKILSITYAGEELIDLGEAGRAFGGVMAVFDTGSTCLEMPRGLFNGYYRSSLFDNFAAIASGIPDKPLLITLEGGGVLSVPQEVWSEPWGCSNPFTADNILLFGQHVFRSYMVIHDMSSSVYRMGFGRIDPRYAAEELGRVQTTKVWDGGAGLVKIPLDLQARVHLFVTIGLGSPPQKFRCVFDTGSILLAVFSGNVSRVAAPPLTPVPAQAGTPVEAGWTLVGILEAGAFSAIGLGAVIAAVTVVFRRLTVRFRLSSLSAGEEKGS